MEEKDNLNEEEEKEALEDVKEDELRDKIVDDLGLDPDEQSDLVDKLVEREVSSRHKLSKAIEQKRKWREKVETSPKPDEAPKEPKQETESDVEARIRKEFEQRDLESMDLPDTLKSEVQKLAKAQNISVRQAAQDPYISYKKEIYEQEQKNDEASISHKTKGKYVKFDKDNPPEVDMATEEGRAEWEQYTEWLKSQ